MDLTVRVDRDDEGDGVRTIKCSPIVRKDAMKQIVYGVVYAPYEIDAHGEAMTPDAVEQMAHAFMQQVIAKGGMVIDTEHDNVAVSAYPVESYIETRSDVDWPVGSWVMGVKIADETIWKKVMSGELNGFSFEAFVKKMPVVVEVEVPADEIGVTSAEMGHDHYYFVEYNDEGRIIAGETSADFGHRHKISGGTVTDYASTPGIKRHAHKLVMQ